MPWPAPLLPVTRTYPVLLLMRLNCQLLLGLNCLLLLLQSCLLLPQLNCLLWLLLSCLLLLLRGGWTVGDWTVQLHLCHSR